MVFVTGTEKVLYFSVFSARQLNYPFNFFCMDFELTSYELQDKSYELLFIARVSSYF